MACVTLKFDGWPPKMEGDLFNAHGSYIIQCIYIRKFKYQYRPQIVHLGSNRQFSASGTLTFDEWTWKKTNGTFKFHGWPWKQKASLLCHFNLCASSVGICEVKLEFQPTNDQFINVATPVTFKMYGCPRQTICHFKFCALFRSHLWVQTGVTVRKQFRSNRWIFGPREL